MTLFRAADAAAPHRDPTLGWGEIAAGGVEVQRVPGDHYSMLREPHVNALAGELRARLETAVAGASRAPSAEEKKEASGPGP